MKKLISAIMAFAMVLSLASCSQTDTKTQTNANTDAIGFSEQTKQAVSDFIDMYGKNSDGYNESAYVVSDFDNTTSVFDITYQTIAYQLEHMAFAMNPEELKKALASELDINADDITPEAELVNDLGINSLELADLVLQCEDKFDIEITDEVINGFVTVEDLVTALSKITGEEE